MSILFKPDHSLHELCLALVRDHQWLISFMSRGELLLWPSLNRWGQMRRGQLEKHVDLCTTLFPDEATCSIWADIMAEGRVVGRPITAADAWIAAAARQWDLPLVTADYRTSSTSIT